MIRFATLQAALTAEDRVRPIATVLKAAQVDIICCQEQFGASEGDHRITGTMADLLGMSYYYSTIKPDDDREGQCREDKVCGMAILSGTRAWMLKSGTFPLATGESEAREIVQFAVIRKQGNTILVLNSALSPDPKLLEQQLEAVVASQLFGEHYGAIVLCAALQYGVARSRLRRWIAAPRSKNLYDVKVIGPDGGWGSAAEIGRGTMHGQGYTSMLLFTNREKPLARVDVGSSSDLLLPQQGGAAAHRLGFTADFALTRLPLEKKNGRYRLPSFREQWKTTRERELETANSATAGY